MGYNGRMFVEDDESPAISDQQPAEAEDQFDENLLLDLERRQSSQSQ